MKLFEPALTLFFEQVSEVFRASIKKIYYRKISEFETVLVLPKHPYW